jgi:hypothetical protein
MEIYPTFNASETPFYNQYLIIFPLSKGERAGGEVK